MPRMENQMISVFTRSAWTWTPVNLIPMPLNRTAKTLMKMDVCSPLDIRGVRQRRSASKSGWNHVHLIHRTVMTVMKMDVSALLDIRGVRQRPNANNLGWNHVHLIRQKVA